MEQLLHYVWKHRLFSPRPLFTTRGERVEVVDPGLPNANAGPDFFNAKIKMGGIIWAGNVEIHDLASQWHLHGHDQDERYNNVVLHVVGKADREVVTQDGKTLAQVVMEIPPEVQRHFDELRTADRYPPCYKIVPHLPALLVHSWLSALQTERLEQKTEAVLRRVERCGGSWEAAFFVTLARNYGFGINGDAFEQWAYRIPLSCAERYRDQPQQVEALLMGQAGLLEEEAIPVKYRQEAVQSEYFGQLKTAYQQMVREYNLQPMQAHLWLFLRLRPQNFPHIRLSQLAQLYASRRASLEKIVACNDIGQLRTVLSTAVSPYWQRHYIFGGESKASKKALSVASRDVLILNTVIPVLFAYGRHLHREEWCNRAFQLLEELKAEDNHIVRMWQTCGLAVSHAGDTQALIQLKNEYCDRKGCLKCRIGYAYLKRKSGMEGSQERPLRPVLGP